MNLPLSPFKTFEIHLVFHTRIVRRQTLQVCRQYFLMLTCRNSTVLTCMHEQAVTFNFTWMHLHYTTTQSSRMCVRLIHGYYLIYSEMWPPAEGAGNFYNPRHFCETEPGRTTHSIHSDWTTFPRLQNCIWDCGAQFVSIYCQYFCNVSRKGRGKPTKHNSSKNKH